MKVRILYKWITKTLPVIVIPKPERSYQSEPKKLLAHPMTIGGC